MRKLFCLLILFLVYPMIPVEAIFPPGQDRTIYSGIQEDDGFKSGFRKAKEYINDEQYRDALDILLGLIVKDPGNCNLNFLIGYCYYQLPAERMKALPYLQDAVGSTVAEYHDNSSRERRAPVYAFYYLGLCYHLTGQLEESKANLEKFRAFLVTSNGRLIKERNFEVLQEVNNAISQSDYAAQLMTEPVKVDWIPVPEINKEVYSAFGAQMTSDLMHVYYSAIRMKDSIKANCDIYEIFKENEPWQKAGMVDPQLKSPYDDIFNSISEDGKYLLFASNRKGPYNIYYSKEEASSWSEPLDDLNFNSPNNETYAIMSADHSQILFVSDRPGGFGGKDIYRIRTLADGSWSLPENLGFSINTASDEDTPWLSDDGNTLWFSSSGHSSMGGYDVFRSDLKNDIWSEPVNVGYPLNSVGDERYFRWMPKAKFILLSSNREEGGDMYRVLACQFRDSLSGFNPFVMSQPLAKVVVAPAPDTTAVMMQQDEMDEQSPVITELAQNEIITEDTVTKVMAPAADSTAVPRQQDEMDEQTPVITELAQNEILTEDTVTKVLAPAADSTVAPRQQDEMDEQSPEIPELAQNEKLAEDTVTKVIAPAADSTVALKQQDEMVEQLPVITGQAPTQQVKQDTLVSEAILAPPVTIKDSLPPVVEKEIQSVITKTIQKDSLIPTQTVTPTINKAVVETKVQEPAKQEQVVQEQVVQEQVVQKQVVQEQVVQKQNLQEPIVKEHAKQEGKPMDIRKPSIPPFLKTSDGGLPAYTLQVGAGWMRVNYFDKIADKKVCYGPDRLARITVGMFNSRQEAVTLKQKLRLMGYHDAWIAHIDEKRCGPAQLAESASPVEKFTVQVGAGDMKLRYFRKLKEVKVCRGADGITRFIFGSFSSREEARTALQQVVSMGFSDAWIAPLDESRCTSP